MIQPIVEVFVLEVMESALTCHAGLRQPVRWICCYHHERFGDRRGETEFIEGDLAIDDALVDTGVVDLIEEVPLILDRACSEVWSVMHQGSSDLQRSPQRQRVRRFA